MDSNKIIKTEFMFILSFISKHFTLMEILKQKCLDIREIRGYREPD